MLHKFDKNARNPVSFYYILVNKNKNTLNEIFF